MLAVEFLAEEPVNEESAPSASRRKVSRYDPALGDDDLYVGDLTGRMWRLLLVGAVLLALALGLLLGLGVGRLGSDDGGDSAKVENLGTDFPTAPPTATMRGMVPTDTRTPTPQPQFSLATVTPMPPTPTESPTPGPCIQVAQAGDTIFGMALRCGHQDMAVVDVILEMNGMSSANELQVSQELQIPWPTPTPGGEPATLPPNEGEPVSAAQPEDTSTGNVIDAQGTDAVNEFGTPDNLAAFRNMEPTLRPGLAWHTVQLGEDIISIAFLYETSVEVLSQINPEVAFLQCDYGVRTGGPNCSVMIYEGQRLRVPVPLPSPTPTLTPAGTLTPTPTPTPIFNAPYALSPEGGEHFFADQRVTLRWGGTGTLDPDQRYAVHVRNRDTGQEYVALIQDTRYELPGGWQPDGGAKQLFDWSISVASVDEQNEIVEEEHATEVRLFTWDSR